MRVSGSRTPGYRPDDKGGHGSACVVVGSSFNPAVAREAGALLGREARMRGFNIALGGGINLQRDVRNGRNFEYFSEDPLVSATLGAEAVNGTQSEGVLSTLKHYSLSCNETNRHWLDAIIEPVAHRVRFAGVSGRDRVLATGLDHDWIQQGQRRIRERQQPPDQRYLEE